MCEVNIWLVFIASYLLGSVPFGYLIPRIWNVDIRRYGSGNIGATNVFRTVGLVPAALVFGLDLLKGTFSVMLAQRISDNPWVFVVAGALAVFGHTFSLFMKFKGGRGAATGLGVLLAVAPDIFALSVICVAVIIYATRTVSLASIITPILVTIALIALQRPLPYSLISLMVTILILVRHIPNIKRLRNGTEPKIGAKND